jgi:hypothetical protein
MKSLEESRKDEERRRRTAANENAKLDEALKESFPASDPPESTQPGVTGWDLEHEKKTSGKK